MRTDEVELRALSINDLPEISEVFGGSPLFDVLSAQMTEDCAHDTYTNSLSKTWGVFLNDPVTMVGVANYHHFDRTNKRTEVGYFITEPYRKRGIMTKALKQFIAICFEKLDVHRIEATIEPTNVPAIKLAKRCGFKKEADRLRHRVMVQNDFRDVAMYSLIAGDIPSTKLS